MDLPSVPTFTSVASWMHEDATRRPVVTHLRGGSTPKPIVSKSSKEDRNFREFNKRLRAIFEDEDEDYGEDADESTIVDRFTVATRFRKSRIEDVLCEIKKARYVELCFVMDATGSMDAYIAGVRQSIFDIVKKLTNPAPHVTFSDETRAQEVKLGMIAYRDFGDAPQIEVLPFTRSTDTFTAFCQKLDSTGGDDGPEDVFGGLDAALKLDWSPNAGTKVIFHIADAPCHGDEFHAPMRENYPNGDPRGLKHTELFSRIRAQRIQYFFGKITDQTDIMIKKFEEAYDEPITHFDIKNVDKITDAVITAVSGSISASICASKRAVGAARKERTYVFNKTEPSWASLPPLTGKFMSYAYPESIKDIKDDIALERMQPKTASVKIADHPFAKGAERVAFYGKDLSTFVKGKKGKILKNKDELIVLKEYLHLGKGMNSSKRYELSNQMQTIASFLAEKYVEDIQRKTGMKKTVKFTKIRTLAMYNGPNPRFMSVECRFAPGDKFIRFTNNVGYGIVEEKAVSLGISMEFVELVMAFSHWTYKSTNRFLMVVDLEGVVGKLGKDGEIGVLLTDPAIHCKDITRYGPMNHGSKGMDSFFRHHECNNFCEYLGLTKFVPKGSSSSMPI